MNLSDAGIEEEEVKLVDVREKDADERAKQWHITGRRR